MPDVREVNRFGNEVTRSGKYKYYSDSSFIAGDSPKEIDVLTDLGREAGDGFITVDGTGDIYVQFITVEQSDYGDTVTLKSGEVFDVFPSNVKKIKLTHSGTNSAYRIFVC